MSYATRTDLEERYGATELTQRESMLAAGAVARALADADAEIDAYLAGRYSTPLSPVPSAIPRLACAIARYNLAGDTATERARKDYEDARAFLRDVQAGRALLDGATQFSAASPAATVSATSSDRVFSREAR